MNDYAKFLESKRSVIESVGFAIDESQINSAAFDYQKDIIRWAVWRGRAACFLDTGTGKTIIQLDWARLIHQYTGGRILILAPLAVAQQTAREAAKFAIPCNVSVCRDSLDLCDGINVTNYERLHHFDASDFAGIVLDESSILKGFGGAMRKQITDFARSIKYRLACTATPAPNDLIELTNHAEFLDVMSGKEIIALFFVHDGNTTHQWRLKGHAKKDFWKWLGQWSVALRKPSDLGYSDDGFDLPPLNIQHHVIAGIPSEGELFVIEAKGLAEQRAAKRATLEERVQKVADLVNNSDESWIVWCELNAESDALKRAIPDAVEIVGSDSPEKKESDLASFISQESRVMVTKPSIAGFGLNLQHCHNIAFVGLSHSYEQFYQAVRRCWRYGQTRPVECHIVSTEQEGRVIANIQRKEKQARQMFDEVIKNMDVQNLKGRQTRDEMTYRESIFECDDFTAMLGDSCERIKEIPDESIGLSIFSPPFPGMYAYTNSPRDVGNCANTEKVIEHFSFIALELLRISMPGRSCVVHLANEPIFKHTVGYSGIRDFRGAMVVEMEKAGWVFVSERMIDKDPQLKAARTKDHGLAMKSAAKDSALLTATMADYLLQFRKKGDNPKPIRALIDHPTDEKQRNPDGWITAEEWIQWASCVWYGYHRIGKGGIRETDVLSVRAAKDDDDEKHLCPLQLGVIERAVKLWSAPGDIVFS
ncbi:MAG: helicase-related protein, partial [Thermoguttaceae bacterium]